MQSITTSLDEIIQKALLNKCDRHIEGHDMSYMDVKVDEDQIYVFIFTYEHKNNSKCNFTFKEDDNTYVTLNIDALFNTIYVKIKNMEMKRPIPVIIELSYPLMQIGQPNIITQLIYENCIFEEYYFGNKKCEIQYNNCVIERMPLWS